MWKSFAALAIGIALGWVLRPSPVQPPQFCPDGMIGRTATKQVDWLPSGEPARQFVCLGGESQRDGSIITWIGDEVWSVGRLLDGELHGPMFQFHSSTGMAGQAMRAEHGELRDHITWNDRGKLTARVSAESDYLDLFELWYESGALKQRSARNANSELHGLSERWLESGQKISSGRYWNGKRDGEWQCWKPSSEESVRVHYHRGEFVEWNAGEVLVNWMRSCVAGCPGDLFQDFGRKRDASDSPRCGYPSEYAADSISPDERRPTDGDPFALWLGNE